MAAGAKLIGPFPDGVEAEEYDRRRRRVLWSMPSGLYVLGSRAGERRNLMTLNWASQVATEPKLVAVSVEAEALTHALVREGGIFSLSFVAREDRAVVRKFVKALSDDGDADLLGGVAVRVATTGAPILAQAVAWLDCRVVSDISYASHTLFVGEVVDCGEGSGEGAEVLRMEDTRMNYGG